MILDGREERRERPGVGDVQCEALDRPARPAEFVRGPPVRRAAAPSTSPIATRAPATASCRAISLPIPLAPPVTAITRPFIELEVMDTRLLPVGEKVPHVTRAAAASTMSA